MSVDNLYRQIYQRCLTTTHLSEWYHLYLAFIEDYIVETYDMDPSVFVVGFNDLTINMNTLRTNIADLSSDSLLATAKDVMEHRDMSTTNMLWFISEKLQGEFNIDLEVFYGRK